MANIAVKVEMMDEKCKELKNLERSRKTALAHPAVLKTAQGLTTGRQN